MDEVVMPVETEIVEYIGALRPMTDPFDRRFSLAVYRMLAGGRPVRREEIATELNQPTREIDRVIRTWASLIELDDYHRVVGFRGLTLDPTPHRFVVDGKALYTWCAWDTLFLPKLIGSPALVSSRCPETGDAIEFLITPGGEVRSDQPPQLVSFPQPSLGDMRQDLRKNFCRHVFFFQSQEAGTAWCAARPEIALVSLESAIELGRRRNEVVLETLESA